MSARINNNPKGSFPKLRRSTKIRTKNQGPEVCRDLVLLPENKMPIKAGPFPDRDQDLMKRIKYTVIPKTILISSPIAQETTNKSHFGVPTNPTTTITREIETPTTDIPIKATRTAIRVQVIMLAIETATKTDNRRIKMGAPKAIINGLDIYWQFSREWRNRMM